MSDEDDAGSTRTETRSFAFESLGTTATVLDEHGIIVDTNDAWQLFARLNDGTLDKTDLGINYLDVCDLSTALGEGDAAAVATGLRQILAGGRDHFDYEYPCESPTEKRWFLLQASAAPVNGGRGAVLFHVDITATRMRGERIRAALGRDELLAIPGRRLGLEHLAARLADAPRRGVVAVAVVDITGFELVNRTYGHHTGDEVLVKVALRIDGLARVEDELCRLGGDELMLLCGEATAKDLPRTVDRLREVLGAPIQVGPAAVTIDVAIGTASNEPGSTVDSLMHEAIAAMRLDRAARWQASRPATKRAAPARQADRSAWLGATPAVLDVLDHAIVVHDTDDRVLHATPAAVELLGHLASGSTALPPGWSVLDHRGGPAGGSTVPAAPDVTSSPAPVVLGICDPAGTLRWLAVSTRTVEGSGARPSAFVSTIAVVDPPVAADHAG